MSQANLKAVITADDRASSVIGGVGNSFGKLTAAFAAGQLAANAISSAIGVVTDTVKDSVGAAFKQVGAVENATIALRAYEKNGDKVNKVLKDLIKYARSDTGVLFQREDLFAAAQTLKLYGQSTETLTDKVKILSKGVSLGKTTFQELSSIVGRAAAKGRLDAVDFDMLIERGIGLDKSMRGAKISGEELFKALDKALPAELLKGRANTIDGAFIRLKSGLRDFGATILGVDKDTTTFIEGGLGDKFVKGVRQITDFLSSPKFTATIKGFIDWLFDMGRKAVEVGRQVGEYLGPKFVALYNTLNEDLIPILKDLWKNVLEPLIPVVGTVLVAAIGAAVDALNALIDGFKWVWDAIKNGNPIMLGLIGLFGSLAAVMAFNAVFNALTVGFHTLTLITIPGAMTSITALKTLIASPTVMGAIGVGAAIAAILLVKSKLDQLKADIQQINNDTKKAVDSQYNAHAELIRLTKTGNAAQKKRAWAAINAGYADGGFTGTGASNQIAGVVHKGEYVIPKSGVDQNTGLPKMSKAGNSNVNITVQAGAYMGNKQDARKYAQMIYDSLKDVAQSNGMTLQQMMGQ